MDFKKIKKKFNFNQKLEEVQITNDMDKDELIEHIFKCHNEIKCLRHNCLTISDVKETFKDSLNKIIEKKKLYDGQVPKEWWKYHHKDCGTKYRGCHPTKCPKNQYETTGIWKMEW